MNRHRWDAVVIGAGPAGLSAAFWLARYRRRPLVLDDDRPRNAAAWAVHGYPGLLDPQPRVLRQRLLDQATGAGAVLERKRAARVEGEKGAFVVSTVDGEAIETRRVILAYGRRDALPDIPGLAPLYGSSVFHCPDCDGPSVAGCRVGVLGHDRHAAALALYLLTWAHAVVLLTNGLAPELAETARETLQAHQIPIETAPIEAAIGAEGRLERIRLSHGDRPLDALFFHWGSAPASDLGRTAGCAAEPDGDLAVDRRTLETSVPGIYAAGDIIGHPHLAISAAAEGVRAALAVHRSLLPSEFRL